MFNPGRDLSAIWRIVAGDAEILELLDLKGVSEVEKRKRILKRSQWDDLIEPTRRLNIYFRPSRRSRNEVISEEIVQIDVHVASEDDYIAYNVLARLRKLLHGVKVHNKYLEFDGQLGDLPTMPNFFCAGIRFRWFGVI